MKLTAHKEESFFYKYLHYIASKLDAPIKKNIIQIPHDIGDGFMKWYVLEKGLGLRYYQFSANKDFEYKLFTADEIHSVYKLIYIMEDKSYALPGFNVGGVNFYSGEFHKQVQIQRNQHVSRLVMVISKSWLDKNHPNAFSKLKALVEEWAENNMPAALYQTLDAKNYTLIKQLSYNLTHFSSSLVEVKMSGFILLNSFLNNIGAHNPTEIHTDHSMHFETMKAIEEKIEKLIHTESAFFPKIEELSAEFNMSISTLRRHFKIVFGINIYQYYQQQRMQWARAELEKGNVNIKEISRKLGFGKPDNFSRAFRKEFDMLPGQIKFKG